MHMVARIGWRPAAPSQSPHSCPCVTSSLGGYGISSPSVSFPLSNYSFGLCLKAITFYKKVTTVPSREMQIWRWGSLRELVMSRALCLMAGRTSHSIHRAQRSLEMWALPLSYQEVQSSGDNQPLAQARGPSHHGHTSMRSRVGWDCV